MYLSMRGFIRCGNEEANHATAVELNVCIYGWRVCSSCVDVNPYRADRKLAESHESGSNIMAQGIVTAAAIII